MTHMLELVRSSSYTNLPIQTDQTAATSDLFVRQDRLTPLQKTALKVVCASGCFLSVIPYISPAKEFVGDSHPVLQNLFASGEIISWGTLYALSASHIIDQLSARGTKKSPKPSCYWISVTVFGLASQLPGAYVIYRYNRSVIWTILTPITYSFFSMHSIDKAYSESSFLHANTYIRPRQISVFTKRKCLVEALKNCITVLVNKSLFLELDVKLKEALTGDIYERDAFLQILQMGFESKGALESHSPRLDALRKYFNRTGTSLALTKSILEGYLIFQGCQLVMNNGPLIGIIATIAVAPMAFLSLKMSYETYDEIFSTFAKRTSLVTAKSYSFQSLKKTTAIAKCLCLAISIFGLGSLLTVVRDSYGYDNVWVGTLSVITAFSIWTILFRGLQHAQSEIIPLVAKRFGSQEDIADYRLIESIQSLIGLVSRASEANINQLFESVVPTSEATYLEERAALI